MKCTNSTLHAVYQKTQLSCYYAPLWSDGYDVGVGGEMGEKKCLVCSPENLNLNTYK